MSKTVFFIGGGKMAEGIIGGLIKNKIYEAKNITVSDAIPERLEYLKQTYGVKTSTDNEKNIKKADMTVIAVPPHIAGKLEGVMKLIPADKILMAICAGVHLSSYEAWAGEDKKIVRVMPNSMAKLGIGCTAVCPNKNITAEDKAVIDAAMGAIGSVFYMADDMFDQFTAFGCQGPLYFYYMMSALIDAGVREGFSRSDATKMVIENAIGAAKNLELNGGCHPGEIINTMTTPAGTTIEGLYELEKSNLRAAMYDAVRASARRSSELG